MNGLNLRPFEATAARSLVVNEDVPDLAQVFEPDREIMVFQSLEEIVEKFVAISKDAPLREKIAESGYRRTLNEHTFVHRANFITKHLGL